MHDITGSHDGGDLALAVVVSRFNATITDSLLAGALAELAALGVPDEALTVVHVPGALELALAARYLAFSGDVDAVLVLGAVIRGETDHYDFVCSQAIRGCLGVADKSGIPVAFGVLTCETLAQAAARSADDEHNKGRQTARAAVEMANLIEQLEPGLPLEGLLDDDGELLDEDVPFDEDDGLRCPGVGDGEP